MSAKKAAKKQPADGVKKPNLTKEGKRKHKPGQLALKCAACLDSCVISTQANARSAFGALHAAL